MKITKFTQLDVWKRGHLLVLRVYELVGEFPKSESFILVPQILRSSISVNSNIAEGFSRRSKKEKVRFYYISLGSLTELQNQLLIAKDLGYISERDFSDIAENSIIVQKMLNKLISSVRNS